MNSSQRILGITVLSDFILSEGVEPIIENLLEIGATAVACNPTVTAPAPDGTGTFQPPADAGSSPRLFDRELFGKHSLWVQSAPSYHPNSKHYVKSSYAPRKTKQLTDKSGHIVAEFIDGAKAAGLNVYLQLGAVQPTGMRDHDRPRQPDGSIANQRMADTGSLASDAIFEYNKAYWNDLIEAYPNVDGVRIDWPEYPCYTFGELFHDFGPHVQSFADEHGVDYPPISEAVTELYQHLSGSLETAHLEATRGMVLIDAFRSLCEQFGIRNTEAVNQWWDLKSTLSNECIRRWRTIVGDTELTAHAFMPPYTQATGLDLTQASRVADFVSPKFYTMHWPLMVDFWTTWLLERNPNVDRSTLVRTVASWMQLGSESEIDERIDLYRYPNPDEPHPIPDGTQQNKLRQARALCGDNADKLVPLVHGYGPLRDFSKRFEIVATSDVRGVWINRYGYLSDEKLQAIKRVFSR